MRENIKEYRLKSHKFTIEEGNWFTKYRLEVFLKKARIGEMFYPLTDEIIVLSGERYESLKGDAEKITKTTPILEIRKVENKTFVAITTNSKYYFSTRLTFSGSPSELLLFFKGGANA